MIQYFSRKMSKIKNRKGFTLIELIVVIAILGILAAIVMPRMGAFRRDARQSAINATASTVYRAAMAYHAVNGNLDDFDVTKYVDGDANCSLDDLDPDAVGDNGFVTCTEVGPTDAMEGTFPVQAP